MAKLHLGDGAFAQYTSAVAERRGESRYELTVDGARKLVDSVLGKSGLEMLAPYYERLDATLREPEKMAAPRARAAKASSPKASHAVTISLRRTSGKGTFWAIGTPPVVWPPGTMVQFVLPRCFTRGAMAVPVTGNPNVVIRFNAPFAPVAAASGLAGMAIDAAASTNAP